ncbi:NUDIX hydrolase [Acrocarpospora sp. B8E8]|uniref:NUDIX hydrolase n=1 Tax=Acrocarpospora sp. B8E8 TaxID=3153572 RepID=UPI00325F9267
MAAPYLEPKDWYPTLPTAYVSAIVLLTDDRDRVLLVKPNYRDYWALPGGILDPDEQPHGCAEREVVEETGLKIEARALLVVDFVPPLGDRPKPMINFLFDGGLVADPGLIRLQTDELDEFDFFSWKEASARLSDLTAPRMPAAREARQTGRTIYLPATR